MEQTARIWALRPDGSATVTVERQSACSGDCHKCSGCGAVKEALRFEAENPIGAPVGALVTVTSRSGPVLAGAAVLYGLPLLLFFLGYFLGSLAEAGALGGGLGFAAGIGGAMLYDRRVAARKKTVYTITGYARTEGDTQR